MQKLLYELENKKSQYIDLGIIICYYVVGCFYANTLTPQALNLLFIK